VAQDRLQPLERAACLGRHTAGDKVTVGSSAGQASGEQNSRRIDAHSGHEASTLLDGTVSEDFSSVHVILLW